MFNRKENFNCIKRVNKVDICFYKCPWCKCRVKAFPVKTVNYLLINCMCYVWIYCERKWKWIHQGPPKHRERRELKQREEIYLRISRTWIRQRVRRQNFHCRYLLKWIWVFTKTTMTKHGENVYVLDHFMIVCVSAIAEFYKLWPSNLVIKFMREFQILVVLIFKSVIFLSV